MLRNLKIFTSGWDFDRSEVNLKNKFQMINLAIILSSVGLLFGIVVNTIKDIEGLIPLESFLLFINFILFLILRRYKNSFNLVSTIETAQFTFLFIYLIYISEVSRMDHIWVFTYPIILLYFQDKQYVKYWVTFMIIMLLIAPLQPFKEISYSLYQVFYMSFVLAIISVIISFYQKKMEEAKSLILQQQEHLKITVEELKKQDKLLSVQSKQAVMGEMISMIAHQWRQPLSTVTLSVSDIQVKKMLGVEVPEEHMVKTLQEISDTVVYLSETIDDFQTYFNPNKDITQASIDDVLKKVLNFIHARVKGTKISIEYKGKTKEIIDMYQNELIQVVLNIMNNAVDAHLEAQRENPTITLFVRDLETELELLIKDNAGGIAEDALEKIFEPYYSTKGKNGTGLGLYMSQMIIEKQFNSKIEVTSSSEGTTFSIKIPKKLS